MQLRFTELKAVLLPLLLCFLLGGEPVINSIYADTLFLSTYPRTWLGYYFMVLPIATSLFFTLANPKIVNGSKKKAGLIVFGIIAILLFSYSVVILTHRYIMPFILAILIAILNVTITIIAFNAISAAFDIRTYKPDAFEFNAFIVIGSIVSSFLIPFITWIGNSAGLFFIALFFMFASSLCILQLKPLREKKT